MSGQMGFQGGWMTAMEGVPPERKELYREIRDKLNVYLTAPIKEDEETLLTMADNPSLEGKQSRVVAGIKYEWSRARLPCYIEWKIMRQDDSLYGVIFQKISEFIGQDWETSRSFVEGYNRMRAYAVNEQLEGFLRESSQQVQYISSLGLLELRPLGEIRQERVRQEHQDKISEFVASKGFSKLELELVTIPISQLLAQMFNNGNTNSKYLALTWDDFEKDEDVNKKREKSRKKASRKRKQRVQAAIEKQPHDTYPAASIVADDDQSLASSVNLIRGFSDEQASEEIDSTSQVSDQLFDIPEELALEMPRRGSRVPRSVRTALFRQHLQQLDQIERSEQGDVTPTSSSIFASSAARTQRRNSIETIRQGTERRLSMSDDSTSSDTPKQQSKPDSTLRSHVAVPDPEHLFKQKRSGDEDKQNDTSSVIQRDVKGKGKATQPSSILRADAPEFVPMSSASQYSQFPSSVVSPELGPHFSAPMSISTSKTSNISEVGQAIIAREGLNVSFDLSEIPETIKDVPMFYPSEESIKALKIRSLRTRSKSTTDAPIAISDICEVEFAHQIEENQQLAETWPEFAGDHLQVKAPMHYTYGLRESSSEMFQTYLNSIYYEGGHLHDINIHPDPYYSNVRSIASKDNGILFDVPAVLMRIRSGCSMATGQYDIRNNVWRVFAPSSSPGADLRQLEDHPDYLEPEKLLEVQGLEMFLYNVFVAVRAANECHREPCKIETRDDDPGTIVCRGCGPLSKVRYCSFNCLFEDLRSHWTECGTRKFYPPFNLCVHPDVSFPATFSNLFPMIKDISGWDSMERRRIHWVNNLFNGGYGLFPSDSTDFLRIELPSSKDNELTQRVQRLINCALLDRRNRTLISYLYVIMRDALCKLIRARVGEYPVVIRFQFINEWNFDYKGPDGYELLDELEPCECMWVGKSNFSSCKDTCKGEQVLGEKYRENGLKPLVESLEIEHWILRIWYTTHPNVKDWRQRLYGKGFPGVDPKDFKTVLPVLGVGFDGHISKGKAIGSWRPRLKLEAPPPPLIRKSSDWQKCEQDPKSFYWKEPEA